MSEGRRHLSILGLASLLLAGCNLFGPSPLARDTLRAFEEIGSGFSVGINIRDFEVRLVAAKAKYDQLLKEESSYTSHDAGRNLEIALAHYLILRELWHESFYHKRSGYVGSAGREYADKDEALQQLFQQIRKAGNEFTLTREFYDRAIQREMGSANDAVEKARKALIG